MVSFLITWSGFV